VARARKKAFDRKVKVPLNINALAGVNDLLFRAILLLRNED